MHSFQVDLRGIVDLLSKHLYSGPQVYVRELLQNAVDAIVARQQGDPTHEGRVEFEVTNRESGPPVLAVHDNGIGLTEEEVHQFLATIGRSSKRESVSREDFIGQFGIGLLSGFLVSSEIVLVTRSIREDAKPVKWTGRSDGTYEVEILETDIAPGTQVYLVPKPGCEEFFEPGFVRRMTGHFGGFLEIPVEFRAGDEAELVNEAPPWRWPERNPKDQRIALLEYGRSAFEIAFADAIPIETETGRIEGVAYVLPFSAGLASRQPHRVYLKNMLLSENAENLLPDWAFFVRCVLNVDELRPTASRESFHDDENLTEARDALGGCLRDYLVRVAREDRSRLDRLIALHALAIKSLALEDDEFYRLFVDWLPFETSLGTMTLREVLRHTDTIRFVTTRDQFRQISSVAAARGSCIVNAGYALDTELVERIPDVTPDRRIERVDVSELSQEFDELTMAEREGTLEFSRLVDVVLQPYQCAGDLKRFLPRELPALYTTNAEADFLRTVDQSKESAPDLFAGILDNVASDSLTSAYARLCLNYDNPLVQRLSRVQDRELARRGIEMLYVQSLLLGHFPLRAREMLLLNEGLAALIELALPDTPSDDGKAGE